MITTHTHTKYKKEGLNDQIKDTHNITHLLESHTLHVRTRFGYAYALRF